jgi:hypothetical protein
MKRLRSIISELSLPVGVNDAEVRLKAAGWRRLGGGMFASVYGRQGKPYVLKLFQDRDHAYKRFLKLVQSQPDNPHFPKLRGLPMRVNKNYTAVRMEKLQPYNDRSERQQEDTKDINTYIYTMRDLRREVSDLKFKGNRNDNTIRRIKELNKKLEPIFHGRAQLAKALDDIQKHVIDPTGANFDLHDANIMWRGKVPVLTDPVAYGNSAEEAAPPRAPRQFQFVFDHPIVRPPAPKPLRQVVRPVEPPEHLRKSLFARGGFGRPVGRREAAAALNNAIKQVKRHVGKNKIVYDLLINPKGTTKEEILAATGWKQVSIAGMAHAMGLEVRKVKRRNLRGRKETRYFGYIPSHTIVIKKRGRNLRDILPRRAAIDF